MGQSGKVTSSNSAPFATSGGKPTNTDAQGSKGTDFTADAEGQSDKSGGRNFAQESRKQLQPDGSTPADAPWLPSRPQQAGSAAQRVDPRSIPPAGITMAADPGPASRSLGAQPAPRPFKNLK